VKSKVGLAKGGSRRENVRQALDLIQDDIDLTGKSNVFVKVNFVSSTNQLAATHVDGVRALLEFLRERYDGKITIGESAEVPTMEPYRRFGYTDLVRDFSVELVDLSEGDWVPVDVYDSSLGKMTLRYSKQVADSDYRIVIGPAKTHNVVVATLSIKNLAMGSLYCKPGPGAGIPNPESDKHKMHQGHPVHNLNLYLLTRYCKPDLSIIDGYLGMDGDGPIDGKPVEWQVAIASRDPVAADCLTAHMMGFPITEVGYLWYCAKKGIGVGDLEQMEVLGADVQECCRRFEPPPDYEVQKRWRDEKVASLLGLGSST
jgi:uncharacterized protein (DUF362 family)